MPTLILFCDIQLSLKYIHTGQTEMLCSHLGNAYSILYDYMFCKGRSPSNGKLSDFSFYIVLLIKDEVLLTVSSPIFPSILIAKNRGL